MDGATDGASVGFTLGSEEGMDDGMQDGTVVGASLGFREGKTLGNEKDDWWTELLMVLRLDSHLVLKKEWMMGCMMEQLLVPRLG